jgi:hypothetical protein
MRRPTILSALLAALFGCGVEAPPEAPPLDRFYFPTGVHHLPVAGGPGTLLVASSTFDRRYDFGAVTAVSLEGAGLNLPDFLGGIAPATAPGEQLGSLDIAPHERVLTAPFAGMMDATRPGADGRVRLFVPTRSEGDQLFPIDWDGEVLQCVGGGTENCVPHGLSLTARGLGTGAADEGFADGKPRAPAPYGVTVADDRVWVTHLQAADSPVGSLRNRESYLVTTLVAEPELSATSFIPIGPAPSSAVAVGQRYVYVAGRNTPASFQPLRLVDRRDPSRVLPTGTLGEFRLLDVRDIVLSADETRAYMLGRSPDVLLVLSIDDPAGDAPQLQVVGSVPLPEGPTMVRVIPGAQAQATLLAITCTQANALAVYDDATGQLATIVTADMVQQPFGVAVQAPPGAPGARLFVTGFGDGRVAVVDLPDLASPSSTVLRKTLGPDQRCITQRVRPEGCPEVAR